MSRIITLFLLGLGGYFLFQKRYRVVNFIIDKPLLRRFFVTVAMNIPGVKGKIMNMVFPKAPSPTS